MRKSKWNYNVVIVILPAISPFLSSQTKFTIFPITSQTPTAPSAVGNGDSSTATPSVPPFHIKSITSASNPLVKHCVKLRSSSSYRHSHGSVLLVGTTPLRCNFQESMQDKPTTIDCLLLHEKAMAPEELVKSGVHIIRVNSMVMKKLSGMQSTESIDAVSPVRILSTFHNLDDDHNEDFSKWFPSTSRILVLDGIQDPGNLGTLLRSVVAFGWDGAFLLPGCCDPFNEKALRASRGASFQLPIVLGIWSHLQSFVDGVQMRILAGHPGNNDELKSVSCLSYDLARSLINTKVCLILGSEGSGLSEQARRLSELVSIRMAGEFESLNVSVAGGIDLSVHATASKTVRACMWALVVFWVCMWALVDFWASTSKIYGVLLELIRNYLDPPFAP